MPCDHVREIPAANPDPHPELDVVGLAQWAAFVRESIDGLPSANGVVTVTTHQDGTQVRSIVSGAVLHFTPGEWSAFVEGARDGEFDYDAELTALVR